MREVKGKVRVKRKVSEAVGREDSVEWGTANWR